MMGDPEKMNKIFQDPLKLALYLYKTPELVSKLEDYPEKKSLVEKLLVMA